MERKKKRERNEENERVRRAASTQRCVTTRCVYVYPFETSELSTCRFTLAYKINIRTPRSAVCRACPVRSRGVCGSLFRKIKIHTYQRISEYREIYNKKIETTALYSKRVIEVQCDQLLPSPSQTNFAFRLSDRQLARWVHSLH